LFYVATLVAAVILLFAVFRLMGAYSQKKLIDFQQQIEAARNQ